MSATYDVTVSSRNAVAWVIGVGAGRGTGAAVARRFAREGFMVAVTGRSAGSVQAVADEIKADGGRAIEAVGDAQDEAGMLAILGRIETIGPVEVGVYNAGNAIWGPPLEFMLPMRLSTAPSMGQDLWCDSGHCATEGTGWSDSDGGNRRRLLEPAYSTSFSLVTRNRSAALQ
jgi:NAD(P)-dependent dehydrogenase (short-subunit alcohol dehydrogenase family)